MKNEVMEQKACKAACKVRQQPNEGQQPNEERQPNEKRRGLKSAVLKAADFIKGKWAYFMCCVMMAMASPAFAKNSDSTASSGGVTDASGSEMWNQIVDTLATWIQILGAFILVWGGIMIGLSFQSDDPNQRTNGIRTVVAGVIVIAVIGIGKQWLLAS